MSPRDYALSEIERVTNMFATSNFMRDIRFDNLSLQFLLERAFEQGFEQANKGN